MIAPPDAEPLPLEPAALLPPLDAGVAAVARLADVRPVAALLLVVDFEPDEDDVEAETSTVCVALAGRTFLANSEPAGFAVVNEGLSEELEEEGFGMNKRFKKKRINGSNPNHLLAIHQAASNQ
ncbi:hypothetical protein HI849_05690 [Cyanobacteria bacterium 150SLHB]|nr:hypothetical protein PMIT1312_02073 [Prochlorococcus marinus str. MIT 1312]NMO84136.1 hypothetical protein [Prochlorococcus sp. P1344]NMP12496.1 hypothetical protein [Prochlorococcus sp.P1363]